MTTTEPLQVVCAYTGIPGDCAECGGADDTGTGWCSHECRGAFEDRGREHAARQAQARADDDAFGREVDRLRGLGHSDTEIDDMLRGDAVTTDSVSQRVYALVFNGITAASADHEGHESWLPLSERERIAQAVVAELRAGNVEFRLGPLALLAEAVEAEHRTTGRGQVLPADERHFDVSCDDRPDCEIPEHHALEDMQ